MMKLSPEKKRVVGLPVGQTGRVLAGPGTGKTRVLVARYLKFVLEDGIAPDRLLALTFTKKAAGEMQKRIFEGILECKDDELLRQLYGAWIMNFHQFAFRVIKENAPAFGIDPDIGIATEVERRRICRVVGEAFETGRIEGMPTEFESDMPSPKKLGSLFDKAMKIILKARDMLWTPDTLLKNIRSDDTPEYKRFVETVIAVWTAYESELRRRSLIDFGDMIRIVVDKLREDEQLRNHFAGRFEHILVDEFQDTSIVQNEMLRLLSGGDFSHVTVVGDDKQSIYRWRDACVDNLRKFEGETYHLKTNYRSTQDILDLAHRFIIEDTYYKALATEIELGADRGASKAPICVFHPPDGAEDSVAEEAKALGAWVASLTGLVAKKDIPFEYYRDAPGRLDFGDIAILMRSLKASSGLPLYEAELHRLRIPFAIVGGVSGLEDRVLELFKNILRLLIYPDDIVSLLSIVEAKPYSLPDGAVREVFAAAGKNASVGELLNEKTLSQLGDEGVRHRCTVLRDLLEDLEDRRGRLDLPTFLVQAMELTQFHYQLFDEGADLRIIESVSKRIFELIEDLVHKREASLAAFLEAIGTLLEKRQFSEEDALYLPEGRVVIMTMHQAKGLEFKAVAIPGIKQQQGTGDGFYLIEDKGLYSTEMEKWGRGAKQLDNGRKAEQKKDNEQEERCLHYVAITRAEDHLFLSSSFPGGLQGSKRNKPNLFASVLDSLRGGKIPHQEMREVPPVMAKETVASAGESADLTALLDEWQAGRDRLEEARVLTRPVPQGLQFVTWRGLHAFAVCPLQYYYRYVAGVQEDLLAGGPREGVAETEESFEISPDVRVPRGMTPVDFGRFVHSFLCGWLGDGKSAAVEGILDRVADQFDVRGATRKDAIETASQLAAAYRDEETLREREIYRSEWPVRRRVGDIVFQGVIDRVDRTGDGFQIIDYKIGVKKDDYEYQLQFYGWALGGVVDKPLAGAVCYLHKPVQLTPVDMSDADLGAIDTQVAELVEATTAGDYHAKPGKVCGSCDYKDICPHAVT